MKITRSRPAALAVVGLALLIAVTTACGDDSSKGDPAVMPANAGTVTHTVTASPVTPKQGAGSSLDTGNEAATSVTNRATNADPTNQSEVADHTTANDDVMACGTFTAEVPGYSDTWNLIVYTPEQIGCDGARAAFEHFNAHEGTSVNNNTMLVAGLDCVGQTGADIDESGVAEYCNDPRTEDAINNGQISSWKQSTFSPVHIELDKR